MGIMTVDMGFGTALTGDSEAEEHGLAGVSIAEGGGGAISAITRIWRRGEMAKVQWTWFCYEWLGLWPQSSQ